MLARIHEKHYEVEFCLYFAEHRLNIGTSQSFRKAADAKAMLKTLKSNCKRSSGKIKLTGAIVIKHCPQTQKSVFYNSGQNGCYYPEMQSIRNR